MLDLNAFNNTLTLYQAHRCFLKLFEINTSLSHSNEPISLLLVLIDREKN